jgi:hypothetical protein
VTQLGLTQRGGARGLTGLQGDQGDPGAPAPGSAIIRKFDFAHDTAGLLTGAAVYTPSIGDILLDAWIEIETAFNGTSPLCDVGPFSGGHHQGWFHDFGHGPVDLSHADVLSSNDELLTGAAGLSPLSLANVNANPGTALRSVPAKITAAAPIKVCVSQNGFNNGADPASTVGAAVLYLVTCTPA